jgi:hypothetical protein
VVDSGLEADWARREHAFSDYVRAQFGGRWKWIPNIGAYVTTRDPSDYSNVDGVMLEGFAFWNSGSYLAPVDWVLQMNRVLSLVSLDRIVIGQTYPDVERIDDRMFALGSYLLIKGAHTYINLETSGSPEWFPEYELDLGPPVDPLPTDIASFQSTDSVSYQRRYANGLVLVNPTAQASSVPLDSVYQLATPVGGGLVSTDGTATGFMSFEAVDTVDLGPHSAAILLK